MAESDLERAILKSTISGLLNVAPPYIDEIFSGMKGGFQQLLQSNTLGAITKI